MRHFQVVRILQLETDSQFLAEILEKCLKALVVVGTTPYLPEVASIPLINTK